MTVAAAWPRQPVDARQYRAGLEERFHLFMHDGYWAFGNFIKQKTGKGYWARYQLRSVRNHGGPLAVKRFLARPQAQDGFDTMLELDLVGFSIEAIVLQRPWASLFTQQELETARRRLISVGYTPPPDQQ